jgi:hypothetical protein
MSNIYYSAAQSADWISKTTKQQATNAYAAAGNLAIKVRNYALPVLEALSQALSNFAKLAKDSLGTCVNSLKSVVQALPKEAKIGGVGVVALAIIMGFTAKKFCKGS